MSSAFEEFRKSYFEHPSRDGPDLAVLDQLHENEQKEAEDLLLQSLTLDAIYSIKALGYLRSQRALPKLIELLPEAKGVAQVYIAQALWRIGRYKPASSFLCRILTKRSIFGSSAARREAAIALREVDEKQSINALSAAVNDKNYLVRYHAQRSLAVLLGLQKELETLESVMMTGASHEQRKAQKELERLVKNALNDHTQKANP
jgi:HEAT repeat protein